MLKIFGAIKQNIDIILVLILGIVLRLFYSFKYEIWYDEAYTGILMRIPWQDFKQMLATDTNPPAFYLMSKVWTYFVGTQELAIRSLPIFMGIITIILVYAVLKNLLNKEAGIIGAIFIAISPFMIQYSAEARTFTTYGFFTILSFYFMLKNKNYAFAVSTMLLPFFHYVGMFFSGVLLMIFLLNKVAHKQKNYLEIVIITGIIGASLFFSANNAISKSKITNSEWIQQPNIQSIAKSTYAYLFGVTSKRPGADEILKLNVITSSSINKILILVIYFGLVTYFLFTKPTKKELAIMVYINMLIFFPLILAIITAKYFGINVYVERYLFPSGIFFLLGFAYLLKKLFSFEIFIMVVLLYSFLVFTKLEQPIYYKGMRELTSTHKNTVNFVTFTSPMDYVIARYYFGENYKNLRLFDLKNQKEKYLWWPFVREADHKAPNNNTLIVVPNDDRFDDITKYVKRNEHGDYFVYTLMPGVTFE